MLIAPENQFLGVVMGRSVTSKKLGAKSKEIIKQIREKLKWFGVRLLFNDAHLEVK